MIRRGDLLRVPYTGPVSGLFGYFVVRSLCYSFVLSSTVYTLLKTGCIYMYQFYVLFSSVGALLYDLVKLLSD